MTNLDTAIRAEIDEITRDPYSHDHRGYDALRAVLDECQVMDRYSVLAHGRRDGGPKTIREAIARELGVNGNG